MESIGLQNYGELFDGRRVLCVPLFAPRPPISCELYVTNLPLAFNVPLFNCWLNRCGPVYEMRLMMNGAKTETRGYGFVRFFDHLSALRAYEMLPFLFLNGKRPSAHRSQCKRLLYVANIPKKLSVTDLRQEFHKMFPALLNCKCYAPLNNASGMHNRGFAFLEFIEHDHALAAKRYLKCNRIWNHVLNVEWAKLNEKENPDRLHNAVSFGPIHLRKNDYCAKLRLYAMANYFCIPIVVYGSNFRQYQIQYGGVLLKNPQTGRYCCIIVEVIGLTSVFDIHLLICEVATHLLECICGLPDKNYIVRARNGSTAKILFSFNEYEELIRFHSKYGVLISPTSVMELFVSLELLGEYQSETILQLYKTSFHAKDTAVERIAKFFLIDGCPRSCFYSIYPKFRGNYPLNNYFNDTEIVLLLGTATSNTTLSMPLPLFKQIIEMRLPDEGAFILKSQRYNAHPNYKLEYVDVEQLLCCAFYHPDHKLNTPPLWVCGETYQATIFQSA